jgi:hypothetical protein
MYAMAYFMYGPPLPYFGGRPAASPGSGVARRRRECILYPHQADGMEKYPVLKDRRFSMAD